VHPGNNCQERLWKIKRHLAIAGLLSYFYPCADLRVSGVQSLPNAILEILCRREQGVVFQGLKVQQEVDADNVKVALLINYEAWCLIRQRRSQILTHLALALDINKQEIICLVRQDHPCSR